MSQTKYPLPNDLKMRCIAIVRGYDRMVYEYDRKREEILYSSPAPSDGQPRGNGNGDECQSKAEKLLKLEESFDAKSIIAVEQARLHIGLDFLDERERIKLSEAIWDSCIQGRNFIFSHRNLIVGKDNFYERRRKFLYDIAHYLNFI